MSIQADNASETREGQRIAKLMARAGLCSRRDAEQWIAEGRVSVNGEVLTSPAFNVSDADDVRVDGQPLQAPERTRLFLFHKPRGLVTTAKDPEGRSTIFDALPEDLPRVVAIGRLDINTEGLLLLTNDGGLSRVLELPATGWLRRYRVRAHGEVTQAQLDGLRDGVSIDGVNYLGIEARFERQQGSNVWITMGLREGKNREIKRVLEHMGLSVNRLIRVSFGPFELGEMAEGEVVEVRTRVLRDQLGNKLAKQAGANFDAAVETAVVDLPPQRGDRPLQRPRELNEPSHDTTRKRKHVSVLRSDAREESAGPRKRITRSATSDRKGREVKVERVSLARPPVEAPMKRKPRRPAAAEAPRAEGFSGRAERSVGGERSFRAPRAEGGAPRGERPSRSGPPRGDGERSFRAPRAEGRASRSERPNRSGAPRGDVERSFRTPRAEGGASRGERPSRSGPPRGDGERNSRAPRSEGGAPRGERPNRSGPPRGDGDRSFRAPRAEGGALRSERSSRSGPSRGDGERSFRKPRTEGSAPRSERPSRSGPPRGEGDRPKRAGPPRGERPTRTGPPRSGPRPPRGDGPPRGGPRKPRGG